MKDLDLSFEELIAAARVLRAYAVAVEKHLYIDMKVDDAHAAIEEAERLANRLDEAAARVDTLVPGDP